MTDAFRHLMLWVVLQPRSQFQPVWQKIERSIVTENPDDGGSLAVADGWYFELRGGLLMLRGIQGLGAGSWRPTATSPKAAPNTSNSGIVLQLTSGEVDFRADGCLLWHLGIIARVRFALTRAVCLLRCSPHADSLHWLPSTGSQVLLPADGDSAWLTPPQPVLDVRAHSRSARRWMLRRPGCSCRTGIIRRVGR